MGAEDRTLLTHGDDVHGQCRVIKEGSSVGEGVPKGACIQLRPDSASNSLPQEQPRALRHPQRAFVATPALATSPSGAPGARVTGGAR